MNSPENTHFSLCYYNLDLLDLELIYRETDENHSSRAEVSSQVKDAATEAATGVKASAFLHRHYSKFLDAPQICGGGRAMKISLVGGTTRAYYEIIYNWTALYLQYC